MRLLKLAAFAGLMAIPATAKADADLREQLAKPAVAILTTPRQSAEVQLCAADAIGEGLLPIPFPPDAQGTVHIFGFKGTMGEGTVQRVVSLVKRTEGTPIEIRTRSGRADDSLVLLLRRCL